MPVFRLRVTILMKTITIYPNKLKQFGDPANCLFYLVTNSSLLEAFNIKLDHGYRDAFIIPYDHDQNFAELLQTKIAENAHILVITPDCYFRSPKPEILGDKRKLIIMANNSTPTSLTAIEHFLRCGENTEPLHLDAIAEQFFSLAEATQQLYFIDDTYQTTASFNHTSDALQWHQQAGMLDWGQQQLFPSGEISTLPLDVYDMDIQSAFELNGQITFHGYPILHSGKPSYLPQDQQRIFEKLALLADYPLIADLKNGIITHLTAPDKQATPVIEMLEAMFILDSRYKTIIEIGFSLNHWLTLFQGNSAMNEVYAANKGGTIHWGLGLTPFTQYHLDILCPNTNVVNAKNEVIFGKDNLCFDEVCC